MEMTKAGVVMQVAFPFAKVKLIKARLAKLLVSFNKMRGLI